MAVDGRAEVDDVGQVDASGESDVVDDATTVAPELDASEADAIAEVVETRDVDEVAVAVDASLETDLPEVGPPVDLTACRVTGSDRVPLPEASGAALIDPVGSGILLVADSGNAGRALVIDLANSQSRELVLPLGDGAGDDLEGLERAPDGRIFGLTSSGYLRAWSPAADTDGLGQPFGPSAGGFTLVLGPVAVSDDPAWVCDPFGVNCAANYEGLCLHPAPAALAPTACAGWAASKARGELVCLRADGAGYRLDPATRIPVTEPDRLSGCAYEPGPPYRLVAAGNLYAASALWEVSLDAAGVATVSEFQERGAGNQEAVILLPGGAMQSYGDAQDFLDDESPRTTFECR